MSGVARLFPQVREDVASPELVPLGFDYGKPGYQIS